MDFYQDTAQDWDRVFAILGIDPLDGGLQITSAAQLAISLPQISPIEQPLGDGGPPSDRLLFQPRVFDPCRPLLVVAESSGQVMPALTTLRRQYPGAHQVVIVEASCSRTLALDTVTAFRYMFVPPVAVEATPREFDTLRYIVARLRGPGGCPWDREQTHASLRRYLVEEAYEALEALDENDSMKLREELGDVLLQILLHSQLAFESGRFTIEDVTESISSKLMRRHPHVFGQTQVSNSAQVLQNWDAIKRDEGNNRSLLASVPKGMPALAYAQAIQKRAARTGFDWPGIEGVLQKIAEEVGELAEQGADQPAEFGDLLFALVNAARWMGIDAEEVLRQSSAKFYKRFSWMEAYCAQNGIEMSNLSFGEMDTLWEKAKESL